MSRCLVDYQLCMNVEMIFTLPIVICSVIFPADSVGRVYEFLTFSLRNYYNFAHLFFSGILRRANYLRENENCLIKSISKLAI